MEQFPEVPASGTMLADWVCDARTRTLELVADLADEDMFGPRLSIINPILWEMGHVAWFQEKWVLRQARGRKPVCPDVDALYDSAAIAHDIRWDLPLHARPRVLSYLRDVRDRVLEEINRGLEPSLCYFLMLSIFHEDMHGEAFLYTRQTLGHPPPCLANAQERECEVAADASRAWPAHGASSDVFIAGGGFLLGAMPARSFVFDNEKWAHPVQVMPFAMSRTAVTQGQFAAFVNDGGYATERFWSPEGWSWRLKEQVGHPLYWRRAGPDSWERRHFNVWRSLEPDLPMIHVNWFEAEAYCRWAGRRLPSEVEWELAAASESASTSVIQEGCKRMYPWGDELPCPARANLDAARMTCVPVTSLPAGDSPHGVRQMIGNVWEWTATDFLPYPGFTADPYKEYSEPWFGTHKVLRGGCFATRGRLLRNTWRNFYKPERRDIWAGFRTCAVQT